MVFHAFATQPTAAVVSQIRDIFQQIAALTEPYIAADALPANVQGQIRTLVASANRVAALSLTAYREGAAPLATAIEAQRNVREILSQYIDDLAAAWIATAALRVRALTAGPSTPSP